MRLIPLLILAAASALLSGCQAARAFGKLIIPPATPPGEMGSIATTNPLPSSNLPYTEALRMATDVASRGTGLSVGQVAATGSMRPYLGESSLVVLEKGDVARLKNGMLVSFVSRGAERIHVLSGATDQGLIVKSMVSDTEELVPYENWTGSAMAVIYFDPKTAPADRHGVRLLLAADPGDEPADAGTLRILGATMIAGEQSAVIYPGAPGEYRVSLAPHDALGLTLGVPNSAKVPTAEAQITWAESLAGQTVRFQIYHPAAPETGVILLDTTFLR